MKLTYRHFINPHKALTPIVIVCLILVYDNTGVGPLIYLALHGTYCLNWFLKELIFPDKTWDTEITTREYIKASFAMCNYWWSPWILISKKVEPHNITIFIAVFLNISGTFLHYCCDAQKYYMLLQKKQLITSGFFKRSRNLNYFGEIMIYLGFAILSEHVVPVAFLFGMVIFIFYPNMWKKDASLSRYEGFEKYRLRSNLLTPKVF